MVKIGNWIFHYRNFLFPVFYLLLFIPSPEIFSSWWSAAITGFIISFTGEFIRALVMGLVNIQHGGKERTIYSSDLITDGKTALDISPYRLERFASSAVGAEAQETFYGT